MGIFKSSKQKELDKSNKAMQKQMKQLKEESNNLLKSLNDVQLEMNSLPKVYINIDGINLYVIISQKDYKKGKQKSYRKKVDKIFSEKELVRYNWLMFWHNSGRKYPAAFDEELENFTELYGTPYKDFVQQFQEDHSIYHNEYSVSQEKSEELIKEIIKEYQTKYPPENNK